MQLNLGSILQASAGARPAHPAVKLNERSVSFAELDRASRGIAHALRARGIEPGDSVGILLPNLPEFTMSYYGILYAGCTVVPLNVLLSGPELQYHLEDSDAKLLIAHSLFGEAAKAGAAAAGVDVIWADGEAAGDLATFIDATPIERLHPTLPTDTAVVLYTSGTTGKPKGAELTHSNLLINCAMVVPRLIEGGVDEVALGTLPLFHSFGQTCIQNASIARGTTFTLLPRFTPKDALEILERDQVTLFAGVPTMYFALLNHEGDREYDLSRLRCCMSGGAPMPIEVMKAFEAKFGVEILEGYGLSETSPVASFNMSDRPRTPGTIGYPVWGVEMSILGENGQPLPDGERGEICIRGHNVMKGYLNRPEATAEALRGGWFHSGDIGIRNTDGAYAIVDRVKDMIIRGGFNVYPREIEEVLYGHEAIVEAAVIGIPHESHGEEVKAVVVSQDPAISADDVIAYCKQRLAAYKYPRVIEFSEALPKGPTGKILKRELR